MSNALYWEPTPKPQQQFRLDRKTWDFLTSFFEASEKENLQGVTLGRDRLEQFGLIRLTAEKSGNKELSDDIKSLIVGIRKYDCITLNIHG